MSRYKDLKNGVPSTSNEEKKDIKAESISLAKGGKITIGDTTLTEGNLIVLLALLSK